MKVAPDYHVPNILSAGLALAAGILVLTLFL